MNTYLVNIYECVKIFNANFLFIPRAASADLGAVFSSRWSIVTAGSDSFTRLVIANSGPEHKIVTGFFKTLQK